MHHVNPSHANPSNWYALTIGTQRVLALLIDFRTAVAESVQGYPVLLATEADLIDLAWREGKTLEVRKRLTPLDWALRLHPRDESWPLRLAS